MLRARRGSLIWCAFPCACLQKEVYSFATGFAEGLGLQKGTKLAVWMTNELEHVSRKGLHPRACGAGVWSAADAGDAHRLSRLRLCTSHVAQCVGVCPLNLHVPYNGRAPALMQRMPPLCSSRCNARLR
jgi:hypothetical protein